MKVGDTVIVTGPTSLGNINRLGVVFVITEDFGASGWSTMNEPIFPESSLRPAKEHYLKLFKKLYEGR